MNHAVEITEEDDSTQSNQEYLKEKLAISNHVVNNDKDNISTLSNLRVVPVIIPRAIKDKNMTNGSKRSLKDLEKYERDRNCMPVRNMNPPFNQNLSDIDYWRQLKDYHHDKISEIESLNELFNVEDDELFLIATEDAKSTHYVCEAEFLLIADIESKSQFYKEDNIIINRYNSIEKLKQDSYINNKTVEYKIDNNALHIRKKSPKFSIEPHKYVDYLTSTIAISAFSMVISGLISYFGSDIALFIFLVSITTCILSILEITKSKSGSYVKDPYDNTEKFKYDDYVSKSVDDVIVKHRNQENKQNIINGIRDKIEKMPKNVTVNVNSHKGIIVCDEYDIKWNIMQNNTDIYTKDAVEFFTELGFENPPTKIQTHIIPYDSHIDTHRKTLKSDCGDWLLSTDYIEYEMTIQLEDIS